MISLLSEEKVSNADAADHTFYGKLGLADAAIGAVARIHNCTVLADDLDLYLLLSHEKLNVVNFTHLRTQQWGL